MNTRTLIALAEPNRLRIVELLREQPCSVNDVVRQLKIRQPQASKHLHALYDAGLVTVHPHAQQRIYTLQPGPFNQLHAWIQSFEGAWDQRLDRLDDYLKK